MKRVTIFVKHKLTFPVPPRVTPCSNVHPSPTCAVSPITIPVAWSIITSDPIVQAGWISMPKISLMRH